MTGWEPRVRRVTMVDPVTGLPSGSIGIGNMYIVPPNTFSAKYVGDQAGIAILTPTAGKKLQIIGAFITSDDAAFTFELSFVASALTVVQHFESGTLGESPPMNITGATDEVLTLTISNSAAQNWFVLVNYVEVDP